MKQPAQKARKRGFRLWKWIKGLSLLLMLSLIAAAAGLVYLYATSLPLADSDRNSRLLDSQARSSPRFSPEAKIRFPCSLMPFLLT